MKRLGRFTLIFVCLFILSAYRNYSYKDYSAHERERILSLIVPCPVIAVVNQTTPKYSTYNEAAVKTGVIEQDTQVEIVQDRSAKWYRVKEQGEKDTAWVKREALDIPEDEPPSRNLMTKNQLEDYMNIMGFESKTEYFVLTDIYRQLTYIFSGSKEHWSLVKTIRCSTGKNESRRTRGFFKITDRGKWFYSERLGSGAMYWVRFNGSYLFHSIAMDKNRKILDDVIGDRRSMGCVRLALEDAKWLYITIPAQTSVYVT